MVEGESEGGQSTKTEAKGLDVLEMLLQSGEQEVQRRKTEAALLENSTRTSRPQSLSQPQLPTFQAQTQAQSQPISISNQNKEPAGASTAPLANSALAASPKASPASPAKDDKVLASSAPTAARPSNGQRSNDRPSNDKPSNGRQSLLSSSPALALLEKSNLSPAELLRKLREENRALEERNQRLAEEQQRRQLQRSQGLERDPRGGDDDDEMTDLILDAYEELMELYPDVSLMCFCFAE